MKLIKQAYRRFSAFQPIFPSPFNVRSLRFDHYAKKAQDGKLDYGKTLAMWVADMDFQSPPNVIRELEKCASHGLFVYQHITAEDKLAILNYLKNVHNLPKYSETSLVFLPGLVVGLNLCTRAFTNVGEAVMFACPVYHQFFHCVKNQNRVVAAIPLIRDEQTQNWTFDFSAMAERVDNSPNLPNVRLFILCNPHNPVGKVFSKEEIMKLLDFCKARNILVVSDEIHCDLILSSRKHISALNLGHDDIVISLNSPSKTYNLAGIGSAFAVIPNPDLHVKFKTESRGVLADISIFGLAAMRVAYSQQESRDWSDGLRCYLQENRDMLSTELKEKVGDLIQFNATDHEATYLAWLDCSKLMSHIENRTGTRPIAIADFFLKEADIAMNDGSQFYGGDNSKGRDFARLNFACSKETLHEAVLRLERVSLPYM